MLSRMQAPAIHTIGRIAEGWGRDHGSIRTMDRLLARAGEVRARRGPRRRAYDHKPELLATGPHQVWSWEITTLTGAAQSA
jgi:hypothetical protein